MLGMKGAALETDMFKIRVQLTKPVTWVPLIWGECFGVLLAAAKEGVRAAFERLVLHKPGRRARAWTSLARA
jgi:4-hydroxybenzoate polyprenyltransferase